MTEQAIPLAEYGRSTGDWQPDWRASVMLTLVSSLLVVSALSVLPYRWWSANPRPRAIAIVLDQVQQPFVKPRPAVHVPRMQSQTLAHKTVRVTPLSAVKLPRINWQQQLHQAAQAQTSNPVEFLGPQVKPLDRHLQHILNLPLPFQNMQNGTAFHSEYGDTIIKSGDQCGRVEILQMSSAPTNKAAVGFYAQCPGEYRPTMGEELQTWADQHAKQHPPP